MVKEPLFIDNLKDLHGTRIPRLGKRTPRGFERVHVGRAFGLGYGRGTRDNAYLFVDSSGWGLAGELAMTEGEFGDFVAEHPGYGYGVVEAWQFQVVVGVFKRNDQSGE